jgi:hypothetical protein
VVNAFRTSGDVEKMGLGNADFELHLEWTTTLVCSERLSNTGACLE